MRIVDIKERTISTGEKRSNAAMDFSDMTTGFVAVVTDVTRDGKPIVGYGFSGTGRYSQNAICRDRMIPRIFDSRGLFDNDDSSRQEAGIYFQTNSFAGRTYTNFTRTLNSICTTPKW